MEFNTTGKQCFFMLCKNETEKECLERNLFGAPEWQLAQLQQIRKGDIGFLLNLTKDQFLGIFEALAQAQSNIEPTAWGGKFPAQIKVQLIGEMQRIPKASEKLQSLGVSMKKLQSGAPVPKFPVHSQEVLDKVLVFFFNLPQVATESVVELQLPLYRERLKFENVAGLNDIKEFIRERMIEPAINFELAQKYRLRLGGGLLLYGPPGTGKTLIAQATAGELDAEFIEISPSVIRGFPGDAEKKIEELFLQLHSFPRAVVFIDEADALLAHRETQTSTVMERITPVLLAQFSKLSRNRYKPILIIAATNSPWEIDNAFLRPGRLDKCLYVGHPNTESLINLLKMSLQGRPISNELMKEETLSEIAFTFDGYTGADIEQIVDQAALQAYRKAVKPNSNIEQQITKESFYQICKSIPKSVNEEKIKPYIEWGKRAGNRD